MPIHYYSERLKYLLNGNFILKTFLIAGQFYYVHSVAQFHARLILNKSLAMVVDVCQYIHKVSRIARDNPELMALAAKILASERSYIWHGPKISIGQCHEEDEMYEQFNVVRSPQYNHHLREKGASTSSDPPLKPRPIYDMLAAGMVCSREDLVIDFSMAEIKATRGTYYVPEVHPDSPDYAPDSPIARDYSLWMTTGTPLYFGRHIRKCWQYL